MGCVSSSRAGQQRSLARLQQVIDEQTQLIQPLTMLSGRLELLLAQAEIQEAASSPDVIMTDAKVRGSRLALSLCCFLILILKNNKLDNS